MNVVDTTLLAGKEARVALTGRRGKCRRQTENPQQRALPQTQRHFVQTSELSLRPGEDCRSVCNRPQHVTPKRRATQTKDHWGGTSRGHRGGRKPAVGTAGHGVKPSASRPARAVLPVGTDREPQRCLSPAWQALPGLRWGGGQTRGAGGLCHGQHPSRKTPTRGSSMGRRGAAPPVWALGVGVACMLFPKLKKGDMLREKVEDAKGAGRERNVNVEMASLTFLLRHQGPSEAPALPLLAAGLPGERRQRGQASGRGSGCASVS